MTTANTQPSFISVILSTYNSPEWLEKVIWGYACQTHREFEIVIADDGSTADTAERIDLLREQTDLSLRHVWHEDEGFQKCKILNRAIEQSAGDYLIFSDGDCVPRADFVQQHVRAATPERFLSGGYYKLPMDLSQQISVDDIRSGKAFHVGWLHRNGLPLSHRWLRLCTGGKLASLLNRITTTRPTWNGNNASGWANDIRRANGFDERMRYGGEDRELGERLENAGIRGKHIRFQSVCLHLDHARGYVNAEDLDRNLQIRRETKQSQRTQTHHGLRAAA
ncbi:MAG: glycosyltransferase family 2 protein [Rubripirellula sp.]